MSYLRAFGHQAWSLHGSLGDRLIQDLFWRKVQTDQSLVMGLAKLIDPNAKPEGNDIFLSSGTTISLHPDSCGAYSTQRNHRAGCLHGNGNDKQSILDAEQNPTSGGFYLGPLFKKERGWLLQNVSSNLFQHFGIRLRSKDRYQFSQKACHSNELMSDADKTKARQFINASFPVDAGFSMESIHWYSSEDKSTAFGVIYFNKDSKNTVKLPISAWKQNDSTDRNIVFDLLHPTTSCPIYDLHNIVNFKREMEYALICQNEKTCETIKHYHAWITKLIPVTTYSSVEITDWTPLKSMTPIIFPDNSASGCHEAYKLFSALQEQGRSPLFLKRQIEGGHLAFAQDISPLLVPKGECSILDFADHCRQAFGVEPPQGVLPQGRPLLELQGDKGEPELLLKDLLHLGDQMTIFAWRGVGKSLFALLLALCFANGHRALAGRVRPSRKYRVLLIDGEMPPSKLKERARSITKGLGLPEHAANEIIVRSSLEEKKNLVLDSNEGWADLLPDLERAEIIFVDSLFKIIPTAMSSEYASTKELNDFYSWCKVRGKTAIVVDHMGKNGNASFGSMGKDIGVDAELQLKSGKIAIEGTVTKNRYFASSTNCWARYSIKIESDGMTFHPIDKAAIATPTTALPADEDDGGENSDKNISTPEKQDIDQAILDYVSKHPELSQGKVCEAIVAMKVCRLAAAQKHYKKLREEGKIVATKKTGETR